LQSLHAIVFNTTNNLFYAVGDSGTIISSEDGANWQIYKSLSPLRNLYSLIPVNGKLIIGAENSTIFEVDTTSSRGLVTVLTTVDNMKLISATNSNDLMILGSDDGSILYKKTAYAGTSSEWLRATKFTGSQLNSLLFETIDNWFIGVTSSGQVIYSSNGISWSAPVSIGQNISLTAAGLDPVNGDFLAAGNKDLIASTFNSSDFNRWLASSSPVNLKLNDLKCFAANDCFIVGELGTILTGKHQDASSQLKWSYASPNQTIIASNTNYNNSNGNQDVIFFKDKYKTFVLQRDSNLVCYGNSGALWASITNKSVDSAKGGVQMLANGNLKVTGNYKTYLSGTDLPGAYIAYNLNDHTINILSIDGKTILMRIC